MKKQETKGIKTIYSDALFWAMSPMSKDEKYHISRVHESVLRKLIHYDKRDMKITYSSELIANHTFLNVSQIEKTIPYLEKKRFIKCIHFTSKNENGDKLKRRIINVNWDFIQEILSEVPKLELIEKKTDFDEQISNESDGIIKDAQEENLKKEAVEIEAETPSTNVDFNIHEYLTQRRLKFAESLYNDDFNAELLYSSDKKTLDEFFYIDENIWYIKTIKKDKEDLWENIHGVNLSYSGTGTRLKLFTLNKNDEITDSFQLNWADLNKYMETKGIEFGDVTLDNFDTLKQFEKKPLKMY